MITLTVTKYKLWYISFTSVLTFPCNYLEWKSYRYVYMKYHHLCKKADLWKLTRKKNLECLIDPRIKYVAIIVWEKWKASQIL